MTGAMVAPSNVGARVDLGLPDAFTQGRRHTTDLLRDRHPARRMIPLVIQHHPHRALAHLR